MKLRKFQRAFSSLQWKQINLRAASALLIFLLSWIAVPATMFVEQAREDFCSMECCMAEGHCCCAAAKPFVEGKDYSDVAKINSPKIGASCPCPATTPSSVKKLSRQTLQKISHDLSADNTSQPVPDNPLSLYRSLRFTPKSPRAPPSFS